MIERYERKRKVSRFFAQELLLDYLEGHLEGERKSLVEEALKSDLTLVEELNWLKRSSDYCNLLSKTKVNDEYKSRLLNARLPKERRRDRLKFKNWPETLRWGFESFALSLIVLVVAIFLPWHEVVNWRDQIVAHLQPPTKSKVQVIASDNIGAESAENETIKVKPAVKKAIATELKAAPVPKQVEAIKTEAKSEEKVEKLEKEIPAVAPVKMHPQGYVIQMMMKVYNIETLTPLLSEQLKKLGVVKAGQVELGWRKPGSNYFHFSAPEKNYQSIIKTLGGYGPVRIYKNPHPRVMPEGTIRIILTIEDGDPPMTPTGSDDAETGIEKEPAAP